MQDLKYDDVCKIVDYAYGCEVVPHPPVVNVNDAKKQVKSALDGEGSGAGSNAQAPSAQPKVKDLYDPKPSLGELILLS